MKKLLVALVLVGGIAAVAFASMNKKHDKARTEKKMEKKEKRKGCCRHTCMFT
jgi:hypothetical protein